MSQYAFHINTDKCITCKACAMACKDKNNLRPGYKFRRVYTVSTGRWDLPAASGGAFAYSVSMGCNHCAEPACLRVCPANAIAKRAKDGIVFIDKDACIGCGSCNAACPYGIPSLDKSALKADKCDFCRELVETGQSPVCVTACSMSAIDYGDMDYLKSKYPNAVQQVYPIASPEQTKPSLLITRHRKSKGEETDDTARIINMPEELQVAEV
jgi:anaerobic dimethyl sulfoxide reductase subunit B (iron-sulfur subunit)